VGGVTGVTGIANVTRAVCVRFILNRQDVA
jgi:hypothetical protein